MIKGIKGTNHSPEIVSRTKLVDFPWPKGGAGCFGDLIFVKSLPGAGQNTYQLFLNLDGKVKLYMRQHDKRLQQYYKIRMTDIKRVFSKTQKKISLDLPSTYRSLTDIKEREQAPQLNAEILTTCRSKKSCGVSATPQMLRDQLLGLLLEADSKAASSLLAHMKTWVTERWKDLRMHISNRINKLKYLQPTLKNQTFSAIQKEILIEWKKNTFLQGLLLLGNLTFTSQQVSNLSELQSFYNQIRVVITKITFLLFEPCLQRLLQHKFPLEDRLYNHTAVSILTSTREWPNIAEKIIKPHFLSPSSFSDTYDLSDLNARPEILNLESTSSLFKATADSLRQLQSSYTPSSITLKLKQYRQNLLRQIQININSWRQKNTTSNKQIVLDKEDILACIIYVFVTHKMDNIGATLKYLGFLYQDQIDNVLGSHQVDYYRVDLEVVYQFLNLPVVRLSIEDFGPPQAGDQLVSA